MSLPYPETSNTNSINLSLFEKDKGVVSNMSVNVHPLVFFQICDHYLRRKEGDDKVFGIILGYLNNGTLEITNCFGVPDIKDLDLIGGDGMFYGNVKGLHEKINKQESVIGCYSTRTVNNENVCSFIDVRTWLPLQKDIRVCNNPLMLIVDCCDDNQSLDFKLYRCDLKRFPQKVLEGLQNTKQEDMKPESLFVPLYTEMKAKVKVSDADKVAMSAMINENKNWEDPISVARLGNEVKDESNEDMIISMEKTMELLDNIYQYVCQSLIEDDKADKQNMNEIVARTLADIPNLSYENATNNLFIKSRRDLVMINYLAKLTETQLCIAERISSGL